MPQPNELNRSLTALEQDTTLITVIEMGQSSWLVAGIVPGVQRQPLNKLAPISKSYWIFYIAGVRKRRSWTYDQTDHGRL